MIAASETSAGCAGALQFGVTHWLPDETLYSIAARYHSITGSYRPEVTCVQLFGHRRQGAAHDFPARVDEFTLRTAGALGTSEHIVRIRSVLPFYFPFRPAIDAANAIAAVRAGGLGGLKAKLGILASRFGAAHPLKACMDCMAEDVEQHSVSYWHRDHQWPGAWICLKHDAPLHVAHGKVNGHGRFHWYLPRDLTFALPSSISELDKTSSSLKALTESACALGNLACGVHFEPRILYRTYKARMMELGVASLSGRINLAELTDLLAATCYPLGRIYGFETLLARETPLGSQFFRLVRECRRNAHPLRELLLILALFGSWSAFLSTYGRQATGEEPCTPTPDLAKENSASADMRREVFLESRSCGASITASATAAGVAVATGMAWASQEGDLVRRRPKKLSTHLRRFAIQRLTKGASKDSVAVAVGVSIQTVTLILRTEPGLQAIWHAARFEKARRVARAEWARTAASMTSPAPSVLRQLQPAVFAWLYRNDRAWLHGFAESLPSCPRSNNASVRWDQRDTTLSQAIRQVALERRAKYPDKRVSLSDLCDAVPHLKSRLSNLARLPLTRAAVDEATRRQWSTIL